MQVTVVGTRGCTVEQVPGGVVCVNALPRFRLGADTSSPEFHEPQCIFHCIGRYFEQRDAFLQPIHDERIVRLHPRTSIRATNDMNCQAHREIFLTCEVRVRWLGLKALCRQALDDIRGATASKRELFQRCSYFIGRALHDCSSSKKMNGRFAFPDRILSG